ncbi:MULTISPECIES: phytoene/squalene synthase family protein [Streptomyces]|uniref:phytoene/squalene synthase family protein n=1 Tax=Streptomyces TaxID=1883 RepID=UPI00017F1690|nr:MULTISPECIES: phytoene/squalene synthase family protein [unclassified Streptomyces]AKL64208.1 phytoene synthase [Streptomyces sp. Mg1]RPK44624.1 All-trans-phytoene synthase [Streptomyces sp. ADI91-18]WSX95769.1 phytoene/squalene synthase family protein [Streptomyces goshikiensis]
MTRRELDAATITEPHLRTAFEHCRRLSARHGKTYFLATRLLPAARRPAVHALYAFARLADDIVDDLTTPVEPRNRALRLQDLSRDLRTAMNGGLAHHPVVTAVAHTAYRYRIPHHHFDDFLASMRSDLTVTDYDTLDALRGYMHGSAAVIGLQVLPVLGHITTREEAAPHAAALGEAFQLTNFIRDVGEDLDRDRVYLPADLLAAEGVDRELLLWSRGTGRPDPRITRALRSAAALTRRFYVQARPGLDMLEPVSRPCVRTAFVLYGDILDAVARDGYASVHRRSAVPLTRRAAVAAAGLARIVAARLGAPAAPVLQEPTR